MDSKLTKKERLIRVIIGVGAILIMILGVFALGQETDPGEYQFNHEIIFWISLPLTIAWFLFSFANKIIMVIGKSFPLISWLSVILFAGLVFSAFLSVSIITPYQRPWPYELLCILWIFGWPVVDVWDIIDKNRISTD